MNSDEVRSMKSEPKTISVPQAGRDYLDIGKDASYQAAHRGDIPVIQIGRLLRAPVIAMERMLERAAERGDTDADSGDE